MYYLMVLNIYYFIFNFHIIIYFLGTETIKCDFVEMDLFKRIGQVYDDKIKIHGSSKVELNIYKNRAAHLLIVHFLLVFLQCVYIVCMYMLLKLSSILLSQSLPTCYNYNITYCYNECNEYNVIHTSSSLYMHYYLITYI